MTNRKVVDPKGAHIRVYKTLLNCPAFIILSPSAKALFWDMRAATTGSNNGNLQVVFSEMKLRNWKSSATLSSALYELRALGFVAVTRMGGLRQGTRVCSLYRFCDLAVFDFPKLGLQAMKETNDFLQFKTIGQAQMALINGVKKLQSDGRAKQTTKNPRVQKLNQSGSNSELEAQISNSEIEQGSDVPVQNLNSVDRALKVRKAPPYMALQGTNGFSG